MSKKYWVRFWFILVLSLFILSILLIIYFTNNGRPLRFTNFLSYDTKLNFIRNNKLLNIADTLVIGSSMGLNNLDGETLERSKNINFVLNASAWGLNTTEVFELVKSLDLKNIKTVIYAHQYYDFEHYSLRNINEENVRNFLKGDFLFLPYLTTFKTLNNNLKTYIYWNEKALNKNNYSFLGYDKNGDINLDLEEKYINQVRWKKYSSKPYVDERNIISLINMNMYFKDKGIKFIIVTTSHRLEVFDEHASLKEFFNEFTEKMRELSLKYKFKYINIHNLLNLDDSHFIDSSHLNTKGAIKNSEIIINNM